jgi:hypothetical protein
LPTSHTPATRQVYGPDDRLTYDQVESEFPELTHRFMRYQFESGRIDAYKGAGGMNYFRYTDVLALRESLRVSHSRGKAQR